MSYDREVREHDRNRSKRSAKSRGALAAVAVLTTMIALGVGASASLASTGSVYFDENHNVGAGAGPFFNAGTTGAFNEGLGYSVMPALTTGHHNVAVGDDALRATTTGGTNVASGALALYANTEGNSNTAIGVDALVANTTGNNNLGLGNDGGRSVTTGSNNIYIANSGNLHQSGSIRIGRRNLQTRAFLAGVYGESVNDTALPVLVDARGKLGTATAASAKTSGAKPLSAAAGKRLLATVKRLQRQNRRQGREISALRAQTG